MAVLGAPLVLGEAGVHLRVIQTLPGHKTVATISVHTYLALCGLCSAVFQGCLDSCRSLQSLALILQQFDKILNRFYFPFIKHGLAALLAYPGRYVIERYMDTVSVDVQGGLAAFEHTLAMSTVHRFILSL